MKPSSSSTILRATLAAAGLAAALGASRAATAYTTPGGVEQHRLACDFMPVQLPSATCKDSQGAALPAPNDNARAWFEAQMAASLTEDDIPVWAILRTVASASGATDADVHDTFKNWVYCEILADGQTNSAMQSYTSQACPVQ
ncbi:hypothetical protein L6R50_00675 [Myxococcota bacterium]|nr:hypothetical protein [Myxococcota bacterium]